MRSHDVRGDVAQHSPAAAEATRQGRSVTPATLQATIDQSPRILAQRRTLQATFGSVFERAGAEPEATPNRTGLPASLKAGIESLSGMDISDVRVHANSSKPAQLNALAYAQGNNIHLAPGQEQHLPHEAWHVVQQRQGRVQPTLSARGQTINDDPVLEAEADTMGDRARTVPPMRQQSLQRIADVPKSRLGPVEVVQRETIINYGSGTVPETMMTEPDGDFVLNVDTGHMMLADVLMAIIETRSMDQFGGLADVIKSLVVGWKKVKPEEFDERMVFEDTYWIKHALFDKYSGAEGVSAVLAMLPEDRQVDFQKREKDLQSTAGKRYARGGSAGLQSEHHMMRDADKIYCINGYGYSPLTDPEVYTPMANALRDDGRLIIIGAASGPTVKPAHTWSRKQIKDQAGCTVATLFQTPLEIQKYFEFLPDESSVSSSSSVGMQQDPRTAPLETRHTEGGSQLDEQNITIRLVLRKTPRK